MKRWVMVAAMAAVASWCYGAADPGRAAVKGQGKGQEKGMEKAADKPAAPETGTFLLVRSDDFAGEPTYQVMTEQEFEKAKADIAAELKIWDKAMAETEKDWKQSKEHSAFPRSAIAKPKLSLIDKFTDRQKAEKKVESYDERSKSKLDHEAAREKELNTALGRSKEMQAKEKEHADQTRLRLDQARELFKNKLSELTAPGTDQPAGGTKADAGAQPPAAK